MNRPHELGQLKRYVLLSDGEIEPSHSGERQNFKYLRDFVRLKSGDIQLSRAVCVGDYVGTKTAIVLATSDRESELEDEKADYFNEKGQVQNHD